MIYKLFVIKGVAKGLNLTCLNFIENFKCINIKKNRKLTNLIVNDHSHYYKNFVFWYLK